MITPDICTAVISGIETTYGNDYHLTPGNQEPFLYAVLAIAAIGHSQAPRYIQMASAIILSMTQEARDDILARYNLPSPVLRVVYAGTPVEWPAKIVS